MNETTRDEGGQNDVITEKPKRVGRPPGSKNKPRPPKTIAEQRALTITEAEMPVVNVVDQNWNDENVEKLSEAIIIAGALPSACQYLKLPYVKTKKALDLAGYNDVIKKAEADAMQRAISLLKDFAMNGIPTPLIHSGVIKSWYRRIDPDVLRDAVKMFANEGVIQDSPIQIAVIPQIVRSPNEWQKSVTGYAKWRH